MNPSITPAQSRVLAAFHRCKAESGLWPTMQELAAEPGVSKVTVWGHLQQMEKRGLLIRVAGKHKSRQFAPADTGVSINNDLLQQIREALRGSGYTGLLEELDAAVGAKVGAAA